MKLDEVQFFGRGHFLSPDSVINILRSAVPILTVSGAFTLSDDLGIHRSVRRQRPEPECRGFLMADPERCQFFAHVRYHHGPWVHPGITERLSGHGTAHHAGDRDTRDAKLVQRPSIVDRSGWSVGGQGQR